jgi:hypothetical protein
MRAFEPVPGVNLFALVIGLLLLVGLGTVLFVLLRSRGQSVRLGSVARALLGLVWLLPALAATGFVVARSVPHFSDAVEMSAGEKPRGRTEIQSRPWPTPAEAVRDAEQRALRTLDAAYRPDYPFSEWQPPRWILEHAIASQSVEQREHQTDTAAFQMHVARLTLELSPAVRNAYAEYWRERIAGVRLVVLGGLVALAIVIVTVAAAYFRLDLSTGGKYRAGLKLAAVSLIVAGALVLAQIHPLRAPQRDAPPTQAGDRIARNVH